MKNKCKKLMSMLLCLLLSVSMATNAIATNTPTNNDKSGEYEITADFSGLLLPFDEIVEATFSTAEPLTVYGARGLNIYIHTPDWW